MRQIVCHECQKRYNFDEDDFCPRCGAFTSPAKQWDVDACGNVVRVDGINEKNHTGSFVHQEVHKEKALRKMKGLDRDHLAAAKKVTTRAARSAKKPVKISPSLGGAAERAEKGKGTNALSFISAALALLALLLKILLD